MGRTRLKSWNAEPPATPSVRNVTEPRACASGRDPNRARLQAGSNVRRRRSNELTEGGGRPGGARFAALRRGPTLAG